MIQDIIRNCTSLPPKWQQSDPWKSFIHSWLIAELKLVKEIWGVCTLTQRT